VTQSWPTSGIDLHLELDSATGRRTGLEQALRTAVQQGRLAPDTRLPASRKLAAELGLSRGTVRAAYDQLIAEGYLTSRQGSGTTVAPVPRHSTPSTPAGARPPRHNLLAGTPDVGAFPIAAWLRSARRALGNAPADAFGYGDPRGRPELREALADYLGRTRGVLAHPDQIVITNGYVQALVLIVRALGPSAIAMEDPGVPFHRELARRNGCTVVPVEVDEKGARTDILTALVRAVVVTSAHQNPTGETLHPDRRRALTDWARSTGGLVVENDYDGEFRYDRQPVGAIQGTAPDQVAYLGSASKTLGPGLRLGWLVLPPELVEPVADAKRHSDHHTENLGQLTLADFIACHGYDRHIRAMRLKYMRRRDLLLSRIDFPVHGIAAGLHALIELPDRTEEDVRRAAAANDLAVGYLGDRWQQPGHHRQGIVIGYGTPADHAYAGALDALVRTIGSI
jgi:GntR family transcriptional regulator/MocR family aminotransferase